MSRFDLPRCHCCSVPLPHTAKVMLCPGCFQNAHILAHSQWLNCRLHPAVSYRPSEVAS